MKTFIHHDFPHLDQINTDEGRTYSSINGDIMPSVTSVLKLVTKDSIDKWIEKVGIEEAERIQKKSSAFGTEIHSLCEQFLLTGKASPGIFEKEIFNKLEPVLDRIDNIHCLESRMYSPSLLVAGTVDCIGEFDGELSVIDFKTSSKPKRNEWIENYWMQVSVYSLMFEELFGITIPSLRIIIAVPDYGIQLFVSKDREKWIDKFAYFRKQYQILV